MRETIQQQQHFIHAEDSVLGLCIYEGTEMFVKSKQYIKTHEIFYDADNQSIWQMMNEMYEEGTPIDSLLLARKLIRKGKPTAPDNWNYIVCKKMDTIITSTHLSHWCAALVEDYVERLSNRVIHDVTDKQSAFEVMKSLEQSVKAALDFQSVDDWADMSQLALELQTRREKIAKGEYKGVLTGIRKLDFITGGLEPGMIVIAARPSMGKTAFAASLLMNFGRIGIPCGIISLEMPNVQLAGRFASIVTGVEFWKIYRNHQDSRQDVNENLQERINTGLLTMSTMPVYSTDNSKVNISDIRWKIEKLVKTKGARVVFVDYIQLVSTDGKKNETREREVAKLSQGLKAISKDLEIVVIALAQLNRESESSDKVSKPGKLSQLRESDAILADADMGIIIDRPFKRGDLFDENNVSTENKGTAIIEKFRNGETGAVELYFDPAAMCFRDEDQSYFESLLGTRQSKITRQGEAPIIDLPF